MKGRQWLKVTTRYVEYNISIERKVTIITGDSGTGKSSLRKAIRSVLHSKTATKNKVHSSLPVKAFFESWDMDSPVFLGLTKSIIVMDESAHYITSKEFANFVLASDNYFILLFRGTLPNIPYSYRCIMRLETTRYSGKLITENKELFVQQPLTHVNTIITEDSNSGRQMLSKCFPNISMDMQEGGNSTLFQRISSLLAINGNKIFVFADGAALGPYFMRIKALLESKSDVMLWAPESFEYLLLLSGIVYRSDVKEILMDPSSQIDISLFPSWERFFTWLVSDIMKGYPGHEYSKSNLRPWYVNDINIGKFLKIIPEEIYNLLM